MKHDGLLFHLDSVDRMRMSYGMPPAWLPTLPTYPSAQPAAPVRRTDADAEERAH